MVPYQSCYPQGHSGLTRTGALDSPSVTGWQPSDAQPLLCSIVPPTGHPLPLRHTFMRHTCIKLLMYGGRLSECRLKHSLCFLPCRRAMSSTAACCSCTETTQGLASPQLWALALSAVRTRPCRPRRPSTRPETLRASSLLILCQGMAAMQSIRQSGLARARDGECSKAPKGFVPCFLELHTVTVSVRGSKVSQGWCMRGSTCLLSSHTCSEWCQQVAGRRRRWQSTGAGQEWQR